MNALAEISEQETLVPADPMVSMMEKVLMNPDLPVERVSAFMDLHERQMNKAAEQAFNQAFAAAMAEMPDIPKSGLNNHTKVRYSTLDDLIKTTRPILSKHGLSLNWEQSDIDGLIEIRAVVRHAMGHKIETSRKAERDNQKSMNALQGGGSTETYLKRYTGFAILGLSSGDGVDDDGVTAGNTWIGPEQFVLLRDKIEEAGVDAQVILIAYGAASLEQFPNSAFPKAMKRLDATIAKKAAQ